VMGVCLMVPALLLATAGLADYERANEFFRTGKYAEAEASLTRALEANSNLVPALTLKGKLAMAFNRFDEARAAFVRAVELEPDSSGTQFLLGFFHYVDNDFAKAIAPLEKALALKPNDARAAFYLALTYEGLAKPDEALQFYRRTLAIEASKPNHETHTAYGRLLFTLGRFDESRVQIERALTLEPRSRDAHYERGRLFFEEGKFKEAAAEGETALRIPGVGTLDRQIYFLLARSYGKLRNEAKSAEYLAKFKASGVSLRR
jgi:tetratricopeptide (TPR) repeat protein